VELLQRPDIAALEKSKGDRNIYYVEASDAAWNLDSWYLRLSEDDPLLVGGVTYHSIFRRGGVHFQLKCYCPFERHRRRFLEKYVGPSVYRSSVAPNRLTLKHQNIQPSGLEQEIITCMIEAICMAEHSWNVRAIADANTCLIGWCNLVIIIDFYCRIWNVWFQVEQRYTIGRFPPPLTNVEPPS
jgi:hypothetical protein